MGVSRPSTVVQYCVKPFSINILCTSQMILFSVISHDALIYCDRHHVHFLDHIVAPIVSHLLYKITSTLCMLHIHVCSSSYTSIYSWCGDQSDPVSRHTFSIFPLSTTKHSQLTAPHGNSGNRAWKGQQIFAPKMLSQCTTLIITTKNCILNAWTVLDLKGFFNWSIGVLIRVVNCEFRDISFECGIYFGAGKQQDKLS